MFDFLGPGLPFWKMHGSGNHFVLMDNREIGLDPRTMPAWAEKICRPGFGVGADGLILLDAAPAKDRADYVWHFFNADGSRPEMCGNGSRCAAYLAHEIGLAPMVHVLGTDAGPIHAEVFPERGEVKVQLTRPSDFRPGIEVDAGDRRFTCHYLVEGPPHVVVFPETLEGLDVDALGRDLRFHPVFAPAGANINFAQVKDAGSVSVRTYERGVEAETYACGTGAAAVAYVAHALGFTRPEVLVTTSGGEQLRLHVEGDDVHLRGPATLVCSGRLYPAAMGLDPGPGRPT
jgi:diaminopimelate epimerase